jgi:hypothetical protein
MDDEQVMATDLDELWVEEWVRALADEIHAYLEKYAAFQDFLRDRADL